MIKNKEQIKMEMKAEVIDIIEKYVDEMNEGSNGITFPMEIEINRKTVRQVCDYVGNQGATINTRVQDEDESTWRENKLVLCSTDRDISRILEKLPKENI